LANTLSILLIFSKNQLFVSLILFFAVLLSILLIYDLIYIISFDLLVLGLTFSYFSKSLRCILFLRHTSAHSFKTVLLHYMERKGNFFN
jgi:hypothetical protein